MRSLARDGLHELEGLRLAERLQRHLADRQVTPQVGEFCGKLRPRLKLITAYRAQQQHTAAMLDPGVSQVAHQVQRSPIYPVQVFQEQHQRRALRQGIEEAGHRFKQPDLGCQLILGGGRQIRIAHPQLRQ